MQYKKAQQEVIPWAVATIVILVISFMFLFAVNILSKTKGAGFEISWISGGDSGVKTQQMLFAILNKEAVGKRVIDLIKGENFEEVKKIAGPIILERFPALGANCDFIVSKRGDRVVDILGGGTGKEVSIAIDNNGDSLKC